MKSDRQAGEVTRNATLAFIVVLVAGIVLANLAIPTPFVPVESSASGIRPPHFSSPVLPAWTAHLAKLSKALLVAALGFTALLIWNFLFQVANPDSITNRRLDHRMAANPLPHADELPLEGD